MKTAITIKTNISVWTIEKTHPANEREACKRIADADEELREDLYNLGAGHNDRYASKFVET